MATSTRLSLSEYMKTSYRPDREFVDGELRKRNVGKWVMLVSRGPQPDVAVDPPVLVVEILSPDDSYTETQSRSADYLNMGVPCVWIIDPTSRTGRQCIGDAWTAADRLEVPGTQIQVNLLELFADLDED